MFGLSLTRYFAVAFNLKTWLWIAAGATLAAIAISGVSYTFGYRAAAKEAAEEAAALKLEHARLLGEANQRNRQLEQDHAKHVADLRAQYAQAHAVERERDQRTIADLRSGAERLRLRVNACNSTGPGEAGTASGGADGAGTAELAGETAAALWGIAGDGDRAIRKLTALQAWAREAVKLCGAQKHSLIAANPE